MTTTKITLAFDHEYADEFAAWINARHSDESVSAVVGRDSHNHVNGVDVSSNDGCETPECAVLENLWNTYCTE